MTITGTLYPDVMPGKGPRDRQLPSHSEDRSHYHHPVVKVNEADVEQWNNLRGTPLLVEHGIGQGGEPVCVGTVLDSRVTKENALFIVASVYNNDAGHYVADKVRDGTFSGFSIGYVPEPDRYGNLQRKVLREVSLVIKPFFEGADISVYASDSLSYNQNQEKNSNQRIFIPIMATETSASTLPVAERDPVKEIQMINYETELKELRAKQVQEAQRAAELQKKNEEAFNELNELRAIRNKQLEQEDIQRTQRMKDAMANIQRGFGEEALPSEFIEGQLAIARDTVFRNPNDPEKKIVDVTASMTEKIGQRFATMQTERQKLEEELSNLRKQMAEKDKALLANTDSLRNRVTSSQSVNQDSAVALRQQQQPLEVNASRTLPGSVLGDILMVPKVRPNTIEGKIYREQYNQNNGFKSYSINASNAEEEAGDTMVAVPAPATHDKLAFIPQSLRNRKDPDGYPTGAAWFSHAVRNWRPDGKVSSKFAIEGKPQFERSF
jgi:hypothetical protein